MFHRMLISGLLAILITPLAAFSQEPEAPDRWGLPDDPLGRRIGQLLDVLSQDDEAFTREFVENALHHSFLEMGPVEMHLEQFSRMREQLGAFEVDNIELQDPTRGELILRTASGERILLSVEIEEIENSPWTDFEEQVQRRVEELTR